MSVYRPVPSDLLTATRPIRHRRALRFLFVWYDAIAGAVMALIALLLVAPVLAVAPWMALWPLGFIVYQLTLITLSRQATARRAILRGLRVLTNGASGLVSGQRVRRLKPLAAASSEQRPPDSRELSLLHGALSLGLTLAALAFILTLNWVNAGAAEPLAGASWLLFVLPVLRAARYSSFYWVIGLAALGVACDSLALALGSGLSGAQGVWIIALHACWLTLISLLPAIALRSLSERRGDGASAMDVAREIIALTATADPSETAFANQAAAIIARRMGYEEINILLVTSDDEERPRGLRFFGAASDAGRELVAQGFAVTRDEGITGWCANHNQARLVNDVAHDPDHLYLSHPSFPRTRAEVAFPLVIGSAVAGVLDAQSARAYAFNDDDIELLRAIASHLALALDTVRRLTGARGLTTVTQGIARRLLIQQELRPALDEIVHITRETLGADSVVLYPCDQESGGAGEPISAGALASPPASAARVARRGEQSAVTQALRASEARFERYAPETRAPLGSFVRRAGVQAAAILPLRAGAPVSPTSGVGAVAPAPALGVIFVNYRAPRIFPPEYQEWCVALADLAALALRSAMLYQRVAEEERANTWHDIHDGMAQHASMGRMLLEQVASEWERAGALSARGGEKLLASREAIRALQRQVNYLIEVWRERDTADIFQREDEQDERARGERPSFFAELDEYAALVRRTLETQCVTRHSGGDEGLPLSLRHDALMIVREAVNNADRHGRASRIEILADCDGAALALTISDNGCGFDTSRIHKSHGLNGIRQRAERRGGDFRPTSSREPGASGTTLRVTLPLASPTSASAAGSASAPEATAANKQSDAQASTLSLEAVAGLDST